MPGRTDNEIMNLWNSCIKLKLQAHRKAHANNSAPKIPANLPNNSVIGNNFSQSLCFTSPNSENNIIHPNPSMGPQAYIPNNNSMSLQEFAPVIVPPSPPTTGSMMPYNENFQVANNYSSLFDNNDLATWLDQYSYDSPQQINQIESQVFMQDDSFMFGDFNTHNTSSFMNPNPEVQAYPIHDELVVLPNDNDTLFEFGNNMPSSFLNSDSEAQAYNHDEPSIGFSTNDKEINFDELMHNLSAIEQDLLVDEPIGNEFSIPTDMDECVNAPLHLNNNDIESLMKSFESLIQSTTTSASSYTATMSAGSSVSPLLYNWDTYSL